MLLLQYVVQLSNLVCVKHDDAASYYSNTLTRVYVSLSGYSPPSCAAPCRCVRDALAHSNEVEAAA